MSSSSQIKNITEKEQLIFMKNLRYLLAINFLTGLALSKKTGISINTIRSYMTGRRKNPKLTMQKKLADVFNVTRYDLLFVDLKERDADSTNPILDKTELELIHHFRNLDSTTQQNIFNMVKNQSNEAKERKVADISAANGIEESVLPDGNQCIPHL